MIHAQLFATFRLIAGVKSIALDLDDTATVRDAIRRITEIHPAIRPHWLDPRGDLHPHVHVFHNGEAIDSLPACLDTPLQPGDTLEFFPPVAGG